MGKSEIPNVIAWNDFTESMSSANTQNVNAHNRLSRTEYAYMLVWKSEF